MKRIVLYLSALFLMVSCNSNTETNRATGNDTLAVSVDDTANADLWAYLYSHEFIAADSLTLSFSNDCAYLNGSRVADALSVADNEGVAASLVGVSVIGGKPVRLMVVRDEKTHAVVDASSEKGEEFVFYVEKEVE